MRNGSSIHNTGPNFNNAMGLAGDELITQTNCSNQHQNKKWLYPREGTTKLFFSHRISIIALTDTNSQGFISLFFLLVFWFCISLVIIVVRRTRSLVNCMWPETVERRPLHTNHHQIADHEPATATTSLSLSLSLSLICGPSFSLSHKNRRLCIFYSTLYSRSYLASFISLSLSLSPLTLTHSFIALIVGGTNLSNNSRTAHPLSSPNLQTINNFCRACFVRSSSSPATNKRTKCKFSPENIQSHINYHQKRSIIVQ